MGSPNRVLTPAATSAPSVAEGQPCPDHKRAHRSPALPAALLACLALSANPGLVAAQTVTAPSGIDVVAPAADYATQAFQDPWDMSQRTDLGWFLYDALDPPLVTNPTFSGGVFSATTTSAGDPNLYLLETDFPGSAHLGKNGTNFPINADLYTVIAFRMSLGTDSAAQLFWSKNTIYDDRTLGYNITVKAGWGIYVTSIPTLNIASILGPAQPWAGTMRSLRFDPTIAANDPIQIDWVRLVQDVPSSYRTITWTGGGSYDIYLDADSNRTNGNLGAIARGKSGGLHSFFVGALPASDYWVAMTTAGSDPTISSSYSPGRYRVEGIPTLHFTAPSDQGSDDEFATVQLGDAWDMQTLSDIDHYQNITSIGTTTASAEDEAGASLGSIGVLQGTSAAATPPNVGDPVLYVLHATDRGGDHPIDPDRYRVLTLEMGLPGLRDLVEGSIARIVWRVVGETLENVSADIVINSKDGTLVIDRIVADMKTLQLETDPGGSPSTTGWTKGTGGVGIDGFRVDPHEFSSPKTFYLRRVKLAAFERSNGSYTVNWNYGAAGSATTLSLYRDTDRQGFNGTLIVAGLDPANVDATHGSYLWDTSGLTTGSSYYLYGVLERGGTVLNRAYSRWPIVKDANTGPTVDSVSPSFGSTGGGTAIAVAGANFQTGATVTLGGVSATGVTVHSPSSITATTGSRSAATVDVVVTNPGPQSDALPAGYTYVTPCSFTDTLSLANQTVSTTVTHQACTSIGAGPSYTIASTGFVTLRAGSTIALRNGFSVASGGRLTVGIDPYLTVE